MKLATLLLVTCELCLAIRVPIAWDSSASEVKQKPNIDNDEQFHVETFKPKNVQHVNVDSNNEPIPVEYFQYTAKKPQFAINVAKFHGVQSPENHYKAYPIDPYTGNSKPELGKHRLLDKQNKIHKHLQEFANINEDVAVHAVPVSSNYEVFHPYEAEIPAMQELYRDPILTKIRSDLENSKTRLQSYEKDAGEPDIEKNEYLEQPPTTDNRFTPQRNVPAPYEIHRPQRRPVYYKPVRKNPYREQYLNQRLRHPWNQYSAKIRPVHYRPIKDHIHHLRQNHAIKFDDERNEYPQINVLESYSSDPKDGYDIYEKGKEKFAKIRNNVDESIIKAVTNNRPATYGKLEIQNNDNADEEDEDEFVPIKNYAQVRKSETYKHLPKSAAFEDAESFEEIRNAPRLREAVKSTKAQTVYSEEGYEDTAYDHAGEQKHASENEGHGGYLKEHELSRGKYKTPSESAKYEDGSGNIFRDHIVHAEKWNDDNKDQKEEVHEEDYSEDENESSVEADTNSKSISNPALNEEETYRKKREDSAHNKTFSNTLNSSLSNDSYLHGIDKRHVYFKVPELDLNNTFLTEDEILKLAKTKIESKKDNIKQKYPYYFKNIKAISKHSPLRYAENLKLIPKKSQGGTEFYDSRSQFECLEVNEAPDPIPDKLKGDSHPDDNDNEDQKDQSSKGDENYNTAKKTPRLKGLGDKIDCFKAKYFGENPLDSPFFKEDIILEPEPVILPNSDVYKLKSTNSDQTQSETISVKNYNAVSNIYELLDRLRKEENQSLLHPNTDFRSLLQILANESDNNTILGQQSNVYGDIIDNIGKNINNETTLTGNYTKNIQNNRLYLKTSPTTENITYKVYQNAEDITQLPAVLRKKRSTSFVYEPYKIIRDGQVQDSKKTTTTSNISPLIRQLQSSRIVDKVPRRNQDIEKSENPVKRNVNSRVYKDIGRRDREQLGSKNDKSVAEPSIVEISLDSRRGEPRYEIRHTNHKSRYTPVENKRSISIGDYKAQTSTDKNFKTKGESNTRRPLRQKNSTASFSTNKEVQNVAASSNTVLNKISTTTEKSTPRQTKNEEINKNDDNEEDYEEYDDEDEEEDITTTTTTSTIKPIFRRRIRTTTTEKIPVSTEKPKLQLVTRFHNYYPDKNNDNLEIQKPTSEIISKEKHRVTDESVPKYREKKNKSTKSTLVTDTKRYGDDDLDMQKEEVDMLIGVKEDMSDYMPSYEKEEKTKLRKSQFNKNEPDEDDDVDLDDESGENDNSDIDDDDEDDSDEDEDNVEEDEEEESHKPQTPITTPEPTKQTLAVTTVAPALTIASRIANLESKPVVTKKIIEIHKELPIDTLSPHVTKFKQDIKEVEIVKEIPISPTKKPQKNLEALELYKDDNLAKDVNKLGGVEIFKKDIDLKNGPRHGGNYRNLEEPSDPISLRQARQKETKEDAEASQSEFTKQIGLEDTVRKNNQMHGGNLRSLNDAHKTRSRGRSSKLIELRDPPVTQMHGGNLKHRGRGHSGRSQKLIELDDYEQKEDDLSTDHESFSNSGNSRPMHLGNYRSEQLVATERPGTLTPVRNKGQNARRTSAAILNSFVQAAPILTTTPAYILDPSKRMYYYVDA